jgi:transposase-like protein
MVLEPVHCPDCNSINVVRHGKTAQRKQRYLCGNKDCKRRSFIKNYSYRAYEGEVKQKITDMAINGSGIRDTARVLKISRNTVTTILKKTPTSTAGE